MRQLIAVFTCICLAVGSTGAVWAQTATSDAATLGFDITAPTIAHTPPIEKGIAGNAQSIVAEISDNQAVERALLSYRTSSSDFYSTTEMSADVTSTTWLANIETTTDDDRIYYYIVAEDTDGNRVQKGSESNPLSIELQSAGVVPAFAPVKVDDKTKWIGIGLGAILAIGLIASGAGGGGDDNDDSNGIVNSDDDNTCCTITFTVPNVTTE